MVKMIKNIFFDIDETLLDFSKSERVALTGALESFCIEPSDAILKRYSEINLQQWKRLERGEITHYEVKVNRFKLLFEEFGVLNVEPEDITKAYESRLGDCAFLIDEAQEVVQKLSNDGYRLFVVTNGTAHVQRDRLKHVGLFDLFENIFISQDLGVNKPNIAFFEKAAASIDGFAKNETLIVGDSLTSDMKGGKCFGLTTVWFNRTFLTDGYLVVKNEKTELNAVSVDSLKNKSNFEENLSGVLSDDELSRLLYVDYQISRLSQLELLLSDLNCPN